MRVLVFSLLFAFLFSQVFAQDMVEYCQLPISIGGAVEPNVLLVVDASGSMNERAYTGNYDPSQTYEGYFDPQKHYRPNADGVYEETVPTGVPCTTVCAHWTCVRDPTDCIFTEPRGTRGCRSWQYPCCTQVQQVGDCNIDSGNYLNFQYMTRMDLLRWALTGGTPLGCNGTIARCNPEVYPNPQLNCDSFGCTLVSSDGSTKVKARWDRITGERGGLLFRLKNLSPRPVMGAMFFRGNGVVETVYIGDFTASANFDGVNPYKNVITAINSIIPQGATPTAPALWDAYNYFAQRPPKYGGPTPQMGEGDKWKNPLYRCYDRNNDGNCQGNEFVLVPCAKNFVILMSDGQWNRGGYPVATTCRIDSDVEAESPDPVVPAYYMHKLGFVNQPTGISSYVESVYAIALWLGGTGELSMKHVAMYGSFDRNRSWPGGTSGFPQASCSRVDDCCGYSNCGRGSPCTPLPPSSPDWDRNGDGVPDTFFKADNAFELKSKFEKVINEILRQVSSGTAVSVLASSEGSGANLIQATFYPRKVSGPDEVTWIGRLQSLWYFVDPNLELATIREDTDRDLKLDLRRDYIAEFYYDHDMGEARVKLLSDSDGNGVPETLVRRVSIEEIGNLWEAGYKLWERDLQTNPRRIFTQIENSLVEFSVENASILRTYLNVPDLSEAQSVIRYVRGEDLPGSRSRCLEIGGIRRVWRLGDIVNSTPRLQSFNPLNSYHLPAPLGYGDQTYADFINTESYKRRGVVYVGANDGMLHAFYLGQLKQDWPGKSGSEVARLEGLDLGKELWAFIPKNALPYLKYLLNSDYCHIYYVDGTPLLVDASIGGNPNDVKTSTSWRTILIGSMGLGGATRNRGSTCTNCIKTPVANLGFSSYFALDVTDPENPQFLWEFTDPDLGLTTTGPAIIRQGDPSKCGRWFVVFASGPTGPINVSQTQFMGRSDQSLKIFVLDLKTGTLIRKIDTGISNAFGGSLHNAVVDTDRYNPNSPGFYQDDAIYIGYTKCEGTNCTNGGVLRILTRESQNPSDWTYSLVMDNIGPVTASVAKLQDRSKGNLWLFFGTGRYFYKTATEIDDAGSQTNPATRRRIFGVKEPCYSGVVNDIIAPCTTTLSLANLKDQTTNPSSDIGNFQGWYVNLDPPSEGYAQERVITDPLATPAGVVFFTTFKPSGDACTMGGNTHVWALRYDTGGGAGGILRGKALLQVSTGEIKEMNLATTFTEKEGRRSQAITGIPPKGQGLSVLIPPPPLKKVLHIRER